MFSQEEKNEGNLPKWWFRFQPLANLGLNLFRLWSKIRTRIKFVSKVRWWFMDSWMTASCVEVWVRTGVIRRRRGKWDVSDCGRIGNISPSTYQRTDWKKGGMKRKADDGCWSWGGGRREKERERSRCGEKKAASIIYQPGVRVDGGIGKGWREEWWRWNDSRGREGGRKWELKN